jgi:endogenous inhibitor of DNA gyrase (YacG/DUF329 family)
MTGDTKGAGTRAERVIRCPGCGGPSIYSADNAYRPFCSARCKNNDFGAWASGGYAVPANPDPSDEGSASEPDSNRERRDDSLPH